MIIVKRGIAAQRGIGRPDYSAHISKVKRGETYPQFEARPETEKYKIFLAVFIPGAVPPSPFTPLAIGETRHYLDIEGFIATPYTHDPGYFSDFREWFFNVDGLVGFQLTLDGQPLFYMVPETLANIHEYEQIVWGKTSLFDPTAALSHTWDFTVTNLDDHIITGSVHTALVVTKKE